MSFAAFSRLVPSLALLAALTLPLSAHADGRALINAGTPNEAEIYWSGDQLRIQTPRLGQSYVLLNGGRAYLVSGGITLAADSVIDELVGNSALPVEHLDGLKATGQQENIAGISGKVYLASFRDNKGKRREEEVVLTEDPISRELTATLQGAARTLAAARGKPAKNYEQSISTALEGRGVLRFGRDYRVSKLEARRFAPGFFARIGTTTSLPDLSGLGGLLRPPPATR